MSAKPSLPRQILNPRHPREILEALISQNESSQQQALIDLQEMLRGDGSRHSLFPLPSWQTPRPTRQNLLQILALDVAYVLPDASGKRPEEAKQVCFTCMPLSQRQEQANWYKEALNEYFDTEPGGSVLAVPELCDYDQLVSFQPCLDIDDLQLQPPRHGAVGKLERVFWNASFEASIVESQRGSLTERFDCYSRCVVKYLRKAFPPQYVSDTAILWLYLGPRRPQKDRFPAWGLALFAVLKPPTTTARAHHPWYDHPDWCKRLDHAVSTVISCLDRGAYACYDRPRVQREASANMAQTVAHESKNLNQAVAVLGDSHTNTLKVAIRRLPPALVPIFDDAAKEAQMLAMSTQWTTAFATAAYWLTSIEQQPSLTFKRHPAAMRIVEAALWMTLHFHAAVRPHWTFCKRSPKMAEVVAILGEAYLGEAYDHSTDVTLDLVPKRPVALMLFIACEPVRNIRAVNAIRSNPEQSIKIWTRQEDQSLWLYQQTLETQSASGSYHSASVQRLNTILKDSKHLGEQEFIFVDPEVSVVTCEPVGDRKYKIIRRTTLQVHSIPWEESNHHAEPQSGHLKY